MRTPIDVEICAASVQSAVNALKGGATRIELCQNLCEGGTTPSYATIKYCIETLKLRTYVLVRPRAGDFHYNELEYETVKNDVEICRRLGATGVVVGFLTPDGKVDTKRTADVVQLARPMEVTFHRAFDLCRDYRRALQDVIDCGCDRILTSGLSTKAIDGTGVIKDLVELSAGRVGILAGRGVTSENVAEIIGKTGVSEVHASCKKRVCGPTLNPDIPDTSNFSHSETDAGEVGKLLEICDSLTEK